MRPFQRIPLGDFIQEEREARGWTETELAARMQVTVEIVHDLLTGTQTLTTALAEALGQAFGTSAVYWCNLAGISPGDTEGSPQALPPRSCLE